MENDDMGEHSRKTRTGLGDSHRPFKKARYVWQLKGKYHLKDSNVKLNADGAEKINKSLADTSDSDSESENWSVNNNSRSSVSSVFCNERCCIDELLAQSNALLDNEDCDQDLATNNIEKSILDEIPVTLVTANNKNLDEYLHKWQARQVAKSFVDNTINTILEHWKIAPFDAVDFVENCENGEQVEDEGILMAIQSHGLQSGVRQAVPDLSQAESSRFQCQMHRAPDFQPDFLASSTMDNAENAQVELQRHNGSLSNDIPLQDPMDFLSTAVTVAIQKKGLNYNY